MDAETKAKIQALQAKKAAMKGPKGKSLPKSQVALAEQAASFKKYSMHEIPMDKVHIFQGEKCIEIKHPQFSGNPRTNVWSAKGIEVVRPTAEVQAENINPRQMDQLMKILSQNANHNGPSAEKNAEHSHDHENCDHENCAHDHDHSAEKVEEAAPEAAVTASAN